MSSNGTHRITPTGRLGLDRLLWTEGEDRIRLTDELQESDRLQYLSDQMDDYCNQMEH